MQDPLTILFMRRLLIEGKNEGQTRAVQSITQSTAQMFKNLPIDQANEVIRTQIQSVQYNFLNNTAAAYRRAGHLCLRSITKGLPVYSPESDALNELLTHTLAGITDADPIVRIAAIETCYDLIRLEGTVILRCGQTSLFTALSIAVSDRDKRVSILAQEVSSVLKEVISHHGVNAIDISIFIEFVLETFKTFIPLPSSAANATGGASPVQRWILEWLQFILQLPGSHMNSSITSLLPSLLLLSATGGSDVFDVLQACQRMVRIAQKTEGQVDLYGIATALCSSVDTSASLFTKVFCMEWLRELLGQGLADMELERLLPLLLKTILPSLSSKDQTIHSASASVNEKIQQYLCSKGTQLSAPLASAALGGVITVLRDESGELTQTAGLAWLLLLHRLCEEVCSQCFIDVLGAVAHLLRGDSELVAQETLEALCTLCGDHHFVVVVERVIRDLMTDYAQGTLLRRLPQTVRTLQRHHGRGKEERAECVLDAFATVLCGVADLRLVNKLVLLLHSMLLTFAEFAVLRTVLRRGISDTRTQRLFTSLTRCWKYNSVCLLSLALLSQHYALAQAICHSLAEAEMSVATLVQLDGIVQQIGSPTFAFLRLALLHPSKSSALIQTLYALLMLLPQDSPQYTVLQQRLSPLSTLVQIEQQAGVLTCGDAALDSTETWKEYTAAQEALVDYEEQLLQSPQRCGSLH